MRKQNEMRETRNEIINYVIENFELQGFEVVGQITDGILLKSEQGFAVLKPIVKKAGFDAEDELQAYADKIEAQEKKETEAKMKKAKREEKAKTE